MKTLYMIYDAATAQTELALLREYAARREALTLRLTDAGGAVPAFRPGDALVFAPGRWDDAPAAALLEAAALHVLEGGRILFLGGGLLTRNSHELHLMTGARVRRALPYGEITVEAADSPLTAGFGTRELWDAAWQFERSVFDDAEVLASMVLGTQRYPVLWRREWYLGRVYCAATRLPASAKAHYAPVLERILDDMTEEVRDDG